MNNAFTPFTIESKTFRIPLYQRPYAWEEPQIIQLLNDLRDAFTETPTLDYHIGILSVAETADDTNRYDLIDGQQRITTLMLIGKAAKEYYSDWNTFLALGRLDLYGRAGDRDYLNRDIETECNPKMVRAVHLSREFFEKPSNRTFCNADFSRYIYEHSAFFLSKVPSNYSLMDKNQQFVRMNNRGKQLEKHEILKVQLLAQIVDRNDQTNAFNIWNTMVSCLTGIAAESGNPYQSLGSILNENSSDANECDSKETLYTSIVTVPEFLLITLARHCQSSELGEGFFNKDKLLETFQNALKGDIAIVRFMAVLDKQVELLKAFFIFISKSGEYELGMTDNDEQSSVDFGENSNSEDRLIAIQSFLYVSTEPYHWLIPAFDWCLQCLGTRVDAKQFVDVLEEIDNALIHAKTRKLTTIDKLEDMNYGNVSHYWFYRLDYELWKLYEQQDEPLPEGEEAKKNVSRLVREFRFRQSGSVEHIKPRHPKGGMKDGEQADDSFGNLALISNSRNSTFNNNPPDGKKDIILRTYAESLKMLRFLWGTQDAHSEGIRMHDILSKAVKGNLPPKI